MGIGAALMELALMPEFAHLVDIRHTAEYGNVYAISDVAVCLGLSIGTYCFPSILLSNLQSGILDLYVF